METSPSSPRAATRPIRRKAGWLPTISKCGSTTPGTRSARSISGRRTIPCSNCTAGTSAMASIPATAAGTSLNAQCACSFRSCAGMASPRSGSPAIPTTAPADEPASASARSSSKSSPCQARRTCTPEANGRSAGIGWTCRRALLSPKRRSSAAHECSLSSRARVSIRMRPSRLLPCPCQTPQYRSLHQFVSSRYLSPVATSRWASTGF